MDLNKILNKVKQKKNLSGIDDSIILEEIEKSLKKYSSDLKEKDVKLIVKDVRSKLRRFSGGFNQKEKHLSLEERKEFYPEIKKILNDLEVKSILDIGCGLNPIMLADKKIKYYAADINVSNLELIKEHFIKNKIPGEVFFYDLRKIKNNLPNADLCLLLKVVDLIEEKGHKLAEKVILTIPCKYILVSFATKTLSSKPMNHPQRGWIERMLNRLDLKFKKIESKNEIFYLIEKLSKY